MQLHLQRIIDNISFETLPIKWHEFDLAHFSQNKTLFPFQRQALENALKGLWFYFKRNNADKRAVFTHYQADNLLETLDYQIKKKEKKKSKKEASKYLLEYDKEYPINNATISFAHFINRMSFWMATGAGKTLVIVKLIEYVGKLILQKELPAQDILFLAHRDDLLAQFKEHVDEFNSFHFDTHIQLKSLKEYAHVKREKALSFAKHEITVFYYRSDLISDTQKEKIVNFQNYDNGGKWCILLDEAHKGDKDESKRQILYAILSRNGFLFNFSATFTEPKDFATCAFAFNLSKFVQQGYGKHMYISATEMRAFQTQAQDDFSPLEKQKIVLKSLLLLAYINKHYEKIKAIDGALYHHPLLLTLVNSVNTKKNKAELPDLELFFRELERVAKNEFNPNVLHNAKEELVNEFRNNVSFQFEDTQYKIDTELISELAYQDILKHVLHAQTPGSIEVLKIPGNKQELIFRLMSTERPFALIKIGDISPWLKEKLNGYEINESFDNKSYFQNINDDDSDITILMGSRAFYEGWDSNRPNILLFINIGVGKKAKKFVLQSVGRGVRIEPRTHHKKRLQYLLHERIVEERLFNEVKSCILPVESLFVFGTNANNVQEIINTLRTEQQERNLGNEIILNPEAQQRSLLVPIYRQTDTIFAEEKDIQKYSISDDDFDSANDLCTFLGDKIALTTYDCDVAVLQKTKESFAAKQKYYDTGTTDSLGEPEFTLGRIFNYMGVRNREFEKFKELEDEIVHFEHIRFRNDEKYAEIAQKISYMQQYPAYKQKLEQSYGKIKSEEYEEQLLLLENAGHFEISNQKIRIRHLKNHYYVPVILSEQEKIDYLNHIINVPSEVAFINDLEGYLKDSDNVFTQYDWWLFSKLDHTLDEIHIPYYDPNTNNIANFNPDFIFWMQKGTHYLILFVDPKGTEHTSSVRKIDGFSHIFETETDTQQKKSKHFSYDELTIQIKLLLKPRRGVASVPEHYRRYWFDNFSDFAEKIRENA